jgi:hypothetical protein
VVIRSRGRNGFDSCQYRHEAGLDSLAVTTRFRLGSGFDSIAFRLGFGCDSVPVPASSNSVPVPAGSNSVPVNDTVPFQTRSRFDSFFAKILIDGHYSYGKRGALDVQKNNNLSPTE